MQVSTLGIMPPEMVPTRRLPSLLLPAPVSREDCLQAIEICPLFISYRLTAPCILQKSPCFSEIAGRDKVRSGTASSAGLRHDAKRDCRTHKRSSMCHRSLISAQQRQISKAREIAIGSDFLAIRRNFDVDSIFACPKSIPTVSKSPVPFKMWRAFVRRKDSLPYFLGSSPASATQNFRRRFICRTVIGRGSAPPRPEKI